MKSRIKDYYGCRMRAYEIKGLSEGEKNNYLNVRKRKRKKLKYCDRGKNPLKIQHKSEKCIK
jgi:hypothetical protein